MPDGIDFFDEARLTGITGTCDLLIGRPDKARQNITEALVRRAADDHKGRALLTLDLASCHVAAGDIDEACAVGERAFSLAATSIVEPIVIRARMLQTQMQPWHELDSVRSFTERTQVETASLVALEG